MKNFTDSDYALNKHSEGIVYSFVDGSKVTVTLENYLAENPDKTADDFRRLKELSDGDYLERDRDGYRKSWKDMPLDILADTLHCSAPSPETDVIEAPLEKERQITRFALAKKAWYKLTEVQRRRYRMYHVDGLTMREIAEREKTSHVAVVYSLEQADKKIKKFLNKQ
ncbi:MAG: RNA polymerase subunit sigma-24 [Clostridiales bacterium]|nr:RNA polymerase subunit sigma-24 [Clostridiales bacterium]